MLVANMITKEDTSNLNLKKNVDIIYYKKMDGI